MELKWSMIEFEKTALVVCENIGTISLTLTRKGDLGSNAFVSIHTQDKTTLTNEDYVPSSAKQVQFDPGMTQQIPRCKVLMRHAQSEHNQRSKL